MILLATVEFYSQNIKYYCNEDSTLTTNLVDNSIQEFEKILGDAILLIDNTDDQLKISSSLKSILELSKNPYNENKELQQIEYSKGNESLKIGFKSGSYKGAFGHYVKKYFYYKSPELNIRFYLTEGDFNIVIDISAGGKKENVYGFGSLESDYQYDYEPNRCYEINTINGNIKSVDFYWD